MEHSIKYSKEQLQGTVKEEEQDTVIMREQEANITQVHKGIIQEEEQEAIITAQQQVVTIEKVTQTTTIKQEEKEITIKEEQQELPVTEWNSLHETNPLLESLGIIIKVKEEVESDTPETQDSQTSSSAVQESVKVPLTIVKEDTICKSLTSKPSDTSKVCKARETATQIKETNPAEIEVCVGFEDLSSYKQDMLYPGKTHPSEESCRKRKAVSVLINGKLPRNSKKGSPCSFEDSAVTTKVLGQDDAANLQEKEIEPVEISVSNRRKFALSVLRDQCLKVIAQWYMGQPFSEIVHNMNLNPDSVRHILHVWCTEKRLACHKPGQGKIKGKLRTRKGQVPTLWKWRFLVGVGKNSTLQCMVCDKRLNSAKMDNIACHIRNWHPYSAELPHRVRRAIHQAWKKRQQGLHKLQELQANCTKKHEMTSSQNEQDEMTSLALSTQQNALQKPEHYSHVQEMKNTINDSRLCNQTKDYTVEPAANNEEKRESDTHQNCNENNVQQTPSKKQRQIRYFQDQWRQKYLVDYDWKTEEVVCLVCGLRMRCLRSCTFERHAQRRHPESIHYSKETRNALWESWNKGEHSFPLLNTGSGMSDFKVGSNRTERQPGLIKHRQPGVKKRLQECQGVCVEELEISRSQAVQNKLTSNVHYNEMIPPIKKRSHNCLYFQGQQNAISESRLSNQIEDYTAQYATHYEDKESDTHFKQPNTYISNTHRKQNDMPQALRKKQKQMRNFQEHWRQKYLVDYDWKTEEAVCIMCGLHMRSLRTCTFERHVERRHPESVHYPEETRNALWETWNKREHIYSLHHTGGSKSDINICQDEMERQPSCHKKHEPRMPQVFENKQKHMRNFQEHWRQKYLVDFDWETEEAVCILCGLHMRCLRTCTFERHMQRRHPESVHYPEKTRTALWETWNKGQPIYHLCHTGDSTIYKPMCQDEMQSQPSCYKNYEPSINTEECMGIQQEQIESVFKGTNSQHEA